MGWKNGVQYCQRNLEVALADVADIASGYVDGILIGTRRDNPTDSTKDLILKHHREVRLVMEQLLKHRLVASFNKAQLFRAVVEFCGHMLSWGVRKPAPGKLLAVERWVRPTTITALRGFLGFANYYSSYVRGYAGIVAPLQDLLKVSKGDGRKGSQLRVVWCADAETAFDSTKVALCEALDLQTVNADLPVRVAG